MDDDILVNNHIRSCMSDAQIEMAFRHEAAASDTDVRSQLSCPSLSYHSAYTDNEDSCSASGISSTELDRLSKELQTSKSSDWITHRNLCLLRRLAISKHKDAESILEYLTYDNEIGDELDFCFLGSYSTAQRTYKASRDNLVPIEGHPDEEPDVITAAVLDDCPECFDFICHRVREMDCSGCNRFGWSYLAIAVWARSYRMLEYLFNWLQPYGSTTLLMFLGANAIHMRPGLTPLAFIARQQDPHYLQFVLDIWEPHLRLDVLEEDTIDNFISTADKYDFCQFVNYDLAKRLCGFGLPLHNTMISELDPLDNEHMELSTAWHAAASNSTDFLNFLEKYSRISKMTRNANGRTPLNYAVRADRYDLVRWFRLHRGPVTRNSIDYDSLSCYGDSEMLSFLDRMY